MTFDPVTIGGIALRETIDPVPDSDGTITLSGQESFPPQPERDVLAAHHSVTALSDQQVVPVVFTDKAELTGFYVVNSGKSAIERFDLIVSATWQLTMSALGSERAVEFESRVPSIARSTELAGPPTSSLWHAPPSGFTSYYTGATVPTGSVVRSSADGPVTAFTGLPVGISPRWTVPAASYLLGASRVLLDGSRIAGTFTPSFGTWELNNGIVRLTPAGAGFAVQCWGGASWESLKTWTPTVGGVALTGTPELTILRNDPEETILRLSWVSNPGRVTVDLSLRRGARFVTGVMKRHASATIGLVMSTAEAATAFTGGLKATAADVDGNRYVIGSSRTITTTTGTASIAKAASSLDFFIGHEFSSAPVSGDAASDLLSQYLGTVGDRTRAVIR